MSRTNTGTLSAISAPCRAMPLAGARPKHRAVVFVLVLLLVFGVCCQQQNEELMPEQKMCCFVRVKSHWKGKHPATVEEAASIRLVCSGWDNCGEALLQGALAFIWFLPLCVLC